MFTTYSLAPERRASSPRLSANGATHDEVALRLVAWVRRINANHPLDPGNELERLTCRGRSETMKSDFSFAR